MPKSSDEIDKAEKQIRAIQQDVDYTVREYPVEVVVSKYVSGLEEDVNELFIPDYQRDLIWDERRQSKFIESLLIGLPIPYLFAADVRDEENLELEGRLEIVDGTQRIRTLADFVQDKLLLKDLKKLTELNGFRFSDLPTSRQRRFNRITLRMIELTEKADEETRRDMFDRINTGSVKLNDMESRRGRLPGPFTDLIKELAQGEMFRQLAPVSKAAEKRFEREELVVRFFTFLDEYETFGSTDAGKVVSEFVDNYTERMNQKLANEGPNGPTELRLRATWDAMLKFVKDKFAHGFAKGASSSSTPRVRFEAIAVGSALALAEAPALAGATNVSPWIQSKEFKKETTSDASNNKNRLLNRIRFVRDRLLDR